MEKEVFLKVCLNIVHFDETQKRKHRRGFICAAEHVAHFRQDAGHLSLVDICHWNFIEQVVIKFESCRFFHNPFMNRIFFTNITKSVRICLTKFMSNCKITWRKQEKYILLIKCQHRIVVIFFLFINCAFVCNLKELWFAFWIEIKFKDFCNFPCDHTDWNL